MSMIKNQKSSTCVDNKKKSSTCVEKDSKKLHDGLDCPIDTFYIETQKWGIDVTGKTRVHAGHETTRQSLGEGHFLINTKNSFVISVDNTMFWPYAIGLRKIELRFAPRDRDTGEMYVIPVISYKAGTLERLIELKMSKFFIKDDAMDCTMIWQIPSEVFSEAQELPNHIINDDVDIDTSDDDTDASDEDPAKDFVKMDVDDDDMYYSGLGAPVATAGEFIKAIHNGELPGVSIKTTASEKPPKTGFSVYIKMMSKNTNSQFLLEGLRGQDMVWHLKALVAKEEGLDFISFRLIFAGRQIDSDQNKTLDECGIYKGVTIHALVIEEKPVPLPTRTELEPELGGRSVGTIGDDVKILGNGTALVKEGSHVHELLSKKADTQSDAQERFDVMYSKGVPKESLMDHMVASNRHVEVTPQNPTSRLVLNRKFKEWICQGKGASVKKLFCDDADSTSSKKFDDDNKSDNTHASEKLPVGLWVRDSLRQGAPIICVSLNQINDDTEDGINLTDGVIHFKDGSYLGLPIKDYEVSFGDKYLNIKKKKGNSHLEVEYMGCDSVSFRGERSDYGQHNTTARDIRIYDEDPSQRTMHYNNATRYNRIWGCYYPVDVTDEVDESLYPTQFASKNRVCWQGGSNPDSKEIRLGFVDSKEIRTGFIPKAGLLDEEGYLKPPVDNDELNDERRRHLESKAEIVRIKTKARQALSVLLKKVENPGTFVLGDSLVVTLDSATDVMRLSFDNLTAVRSIVFTKATFDQRELLGYILGVESRHNRGSIMDALKKASPEQIKELIYALKYEKLIDLTQEPNLNDAKERKVSTHIIKFADMRNILTKMTLPNLKLLGSIIDTTVGEEYLNDYNIIKGMKYATLSQIKEFIETLRYKLGVDIISSSHNASSRPIRYSTKELRQFREKVDPEQLDKDVKKRLQEAGISSDGKQKNEEYDVPTFISDSEDDSDEPPPLMPAEDNKAHISSKGKEEEEVYDVDLPEGALHEMAKKGQKTWKLEGKLLEVFDGQKKFIDEVVTETIKSELAKKVAEPICLSISDLIGIPMCSDSCPGFINVPPGFFICPVHKRPVPLNHACDIELLDNFSSNEDEDEDEDEDIPALIADCDDNEEIPHLLGSESEDSEDAPPLQLPGDDNVDQEKSNIGPTVPIVVHEDNEMVWGEVKQRAVIDAIKLIDDTDPSDMHRELTFKHEFFSFISDAKTIASNSEIFRNLVNESLKRAQVRVLDSNLGRKMRVKVFAAIEEMMF